MILMFVHITIVLQCVSISLGRHTFEHANIFILTTPIKFLKHICSVQLQNNHRNYKHQTPMFCSDIMVFVKKCVCTVLGHPDRTYMNTVDNWGSLPVFRLRCTAVTGTKSICFVAKTTIHLLPTESQWVV